MPLSSNLPGSLSLAFRQSDQFATQIDFDTSLTGYTVSSAIISPVTGATVTAITTSLSDAEAGKVDISLTETQTAALAVGTYNWRLVWNAPGDVQRTALAGTIEVVR
jgi:hypothetical protein